MPVAGHTEVEKRERSKKLSAVYINIVKYLHLKSKDKYSRIDFKVFWFHKPVLVIEDLFYLTHNKTADFCHPGSIGKENS